MKLKDWLKLFGFIIILSSILGVIITIGLVITEPIGNFLETITDDSDIIILSILIVCFAVPAIIGLVALFRTNRDDMGLC